MAFATGTNGIEYLRLNDGDAPLQLKFGEEFEGEVKQCPMPLTQNLGARNQQFCGSEAGVFVCVDASDARAKPLAAQNWTQDLKLQESGQDKAIFLVISGSVRRYEVLPVATTGLSTGIRVKADYYGKE